MSQQNHALNLALLMTHRRNQFHLPAQQREQVQQNPYLSHGDALIRPRRPWDDTIDEISTILRTLNQDLETGAGDLTGGRNHASTDNLAASPEVAPVASPEIVQALEIPVSPQDYDEIEDDEGFQDDNEIQDDEIQDGGQFQEENGIQDDEVQDNEVQDGEIRKKEIQDGGRFQEDSLIHNEDQVDDEIQDGGRSQEDNGIQDDDENQVDDEIQDGGQFQEENVIENDKIQDGGRIQQDNVIQDDKVQDDDKIQNDNEIQDDGRFQEDSEIQHDDISEDHIEEYECHCDYDPCEAFRGLPPRATPSYLRCRCRGETMGRASLHFSQNLYNHTPFHMFNFNQDSPTTSAATWSSESEGPRVKTSKIGGFFRNIFFRIRKQTTRGYFSPPLPRRPRRWWSRVFRQD